MKKINLMIFLLVASTALIFPQTDAVKDTSLIDVEVSYVYTDDQILINRTDLDCSYFIRPNMNVDIRVMGAEEMTLGRTQFSDDDRIYVNKGTEDGLKEGDRLMVLREGTKVSNKITGKTLGTYYQQKSQGVVVCAYETKSIIRLEAGCLPVYKNDILIPYKQLPVILAKKPDFRMCRLPKTDIRGQVVYASVYDNNHRATSGLEEYVVVDIGKDQVARNDILLLYIDHGEAYPPMIIGTAIVIWPENNNSTVKILDCTMPVEMGCKAVYLAKAGEGRETGRRSDEDIPLLKQTTHKKTGDKTGKESVELDILFDINSTDISAKDKNELAKIGEFVRIKSDYVIILRGYSCSIGGVTHNLKLSQQRVERIKQYLKDLLKIDDKKFETYHYGEKDPVYDNTTEKERRKNRRVNVQVLAR